ncbi:Actin-related protein 8 [Leucoagaricus sp. SymC.cos]|nr:Actin-related protein 8 [Leucoagaricus sp. SymC.cos]
MPRGVPNVKKDETGMRYSTFNVPLSANPKHVNSTYLKSDTQTLWSRNASRRLREGNNEDTVLLQEPQSPSSRRGSQVIVIHPGSRSLRIGKASDVHPLSIPCVVARKCKTTALKPTRIRNVACPRTRRGKPMRKIQLSASFSCCRRLTNPALRVGDPERAGYIVRYPIYNRNFNLRDYPSVQVVLNDIEAIIRKALQEKCELQQQDYKNYSVILVIPDLYDRAYVREFLNLISSMGFKRFCAQQESLAATYGAGISNACVVDIGATTTSIACVDEGLVISDTSYREMDLVWSYDWNVMEDLKAKMCTLTESDVATNLYGFTVRRPKQPTVKYGFRVYDEVILAPMSLFEPRIIEFDAKRLPVKNTPNSMVTDEIIDQTSDTITNAMMISTRHLMPPTTEPATAKSQPATTQTSGTSTPGKAEAEQPPNANDASRSTSQAPTEAQVETTEDGAKANPQPSPPKETTPVVVSTQAQAPVYAGGYPIDVPFEASKLPLDVAIFNSVRAAGDDRIRKYLQMVLLIGGTAQINGIGPALESRLQAIATPVVSGMERVQVIPPPKDVNPQILVWKGAAVLGKMESVSELWVTPADWEILGMRGLKERCFFL